MAAWPTSRAAPLETLYNLHSSGANQRDIIYFPTWVMNAVLSSIQLERTYFFLRHLTQSCVLHECRSHNISKVLLFIRKRRTWFLCLGPVLTMLILQHVNELQEFWAPWRIRCKCFIRRELAMYIV